MQDEITSHGGIISAYGAKFINNRKDVSFLFHDKTNPSSFEDCLFEVNKKLLNNTAVDSRVSMCAVKGINFIGCDFKNTSPLTDYAPAVRGEGIYALDAKFNVKERCISAGNPCTLDKCLFDGFTRGVYCSNTNPLNVVYVINSVFQNITRENAYFRGIDNVNFVANIVNLGSNYYTSRSGLYMEYCKNYLVQDNIITGYLPQYDYGIVVKSSLGGSHQIYRNTIDNCLVAVCPMWENADANKVGLKIKCNTFGNTTANNWDIYLAGGSNSSVDRDQGTLPNLPADIGNLVGNKYSATCGAYNKWYPNTMIPINNTNIINHWNNSGSNYVLDPIQNAVCTKQPVSYNTYDAALSAIQGPGQYHGLPTAASLSARNQNLAESKASLLAAINAYDDKVDNGQTNKLLDLIENLGNQNALRDSLLANSPLSDTVLSTFCKLQNYPHDNIVSVFSSNAPVTQSVWDQLSNIDPDLHQALETIQNVIGNSARDLLEMNVRELRYDVSKCYQSKIQLLASLTDSIPNDSLYSTLLNCSQTNAICNLIAFKIDNNIYITLDDIDALHGGSNKVDDACQLQKLKLESNRFEGYKFSDVEIPNFVQTMTSISQGTNISGKAIAEAVLESVNQTISEKEYIAPENFGNRAGISMPIEVFPEPQTTTKVQKLIEVFPNPSSGEVQILLPAIYSDKNVTLNVINSFGQSVLRKQLSKSITQSFKMDNLPNGVYELDFVEGSVVLHAIKLVLIKN